MLWRINPDWRWLMGGIRHSDRNKTKCSFSPPPPSKCKHPAVPKCFHLDKCWCFCTELQRGEIVLFGDILTWHSLKNTSWKNIHCVRQWFWNIFDLNFVNSSTWIICFVYHLSKHEDSFLILTLNVRKKIVLLFYPNSMSSHIYWIKQIVNQLSPCL